MNLPWNKKPDFISDNKEIKYTAISTRTLGDKYDALLLENEALKKRETALRDAATEALDILTRFYCTEDAPVCLQLKAALNEKP